MRGSAGGQVDEFARTLRAAQEVERARQLRIVLDRDLERRLVAARAAHAAGQLAPHAALELVMLERKLRRRERDLLLAQQRLEVVPHRRRDRLRRRLALV